MRPIVLYGAASQAYVLADLLAANDYALVAILNDVPIGHDFDLAAPTMVGEVAIAAWLKQADSEVSYAVSIGGSRGRERVERHRRLRLAGLTPSILKHPTSYISDSATVGAASQVLAFALVGARAKLGEAVIINSRASVDHECVLGDGVHVGPGATLAGRVAVGECCFIGASSTVLPDLEIAANVTVGAGAVVTRSITEPGIYVGAPAKRAIPSAAVATD